MTDNTPITIYTAECIGNAANCLYPNEVKITDEFSAKLAFATDMVCARYKNNYRNTANFEVANALPGDCDNDHSDEPVDWVALEDIADLFADVSYVPDVVFFHSFIPGGTSHHFQHHSSTQTEAVLEQQAFCHNLIFSDAICILGKQFLLFLCHGCQQFILISADQLEQLLALLAGRSIIFCRFDVAIPEFFQNIHNITLHKKCV